MTLSAELRQLSLRVVGDLLVAKMSSRVAAGVRHWCAPACVPRACARAPKLVERAPKLKRGRCSSACRVHGVSVEVVALRRAELTRHPRYPLTYRLVG